MKKRLSLRLRPGDCAWIVLGLGVLGYELAAKQDELMSQAVDRYLVKNPLLTIGIVVYTSAHLLNLLPNRFDLFYKMAVWSGKDKRIEITVKV